MRPRVWLSWAVSARSGNSSRTNSPTRKSRSSRTSGATRIQNSAVLVRHRPRRHRRGAQARRDYPLRHDHTAMRRRVPADPSCRAAASCLIRIRGSSRTIAAIPACCSPTTAPANSPTAAAAMAPTAAPGPRTLSPESARDLLVEAMLRVEAAGYPITLHVHDEFVCEVPIGFGSEEEFAELMTQKPDVGWGSADRGRDLVWTTLRQMRAAGCSQQSAAFVFGVEEMIR